MIDTDAAVTLDVFGLTDRGLVRDGNEDHFLIARVNKSVEVRQTSLPSAAVAQEFGGGGMGGYLLAVADGVGGRPEGEQASERALAAMLSYMGRAATCFQSLETSEEHALLEKLEEVVRGVHADLLAEYGGATARLPATTLTLVLLAWPRAYHVQVGDSRAYVRRGGRVQRLTRDQNLGEYMVSLGAWTDEQARMASTAETLSSAIGGSELEPVVGLIDLAPGDSLLLCTDGLTKHVPDDEIAHALAEPASAEATTRKLLSDALAGGGTDNVTVLAVRTAASE
ncbi:MAG TPA: PP2C family serine/threonine-protein phosphatase [Gemmatimonadaceae bacterium]|jgi:protein phosphatase|nr:PP2C family serine/threonine-protein phosphatase [Gemmatimonadaceae bacterium]